MNDFAAISEPPKHPLRELADDIFARHNPYSGTGFLHHCQRLYAFTRLLMLHRRIEFPAELTYLLAMVHDLGLVSSEDAGANYLRRTVSLFWRESSGHQTYLSNHDPRLLEACLLYNHQFKKIGNNQSPAEAFRCAVWVEHSRGHLTFGLDSLTVKQVFRRYPRDNLDKVLIDFFWRTLRREPSTIIRGIFFGAP